LQSQFQDALPKAGNSRPDRRIARDEPGPRRFKAEGIPGERYYLKAMNCPHHHRIFAAEPRSYRDLPLRLAEYGCCYRYEQSGELFGLMRVRSLNMNDAHIYCTEEQFADEFAP
jgi:threonyl-tRNA synthetase